MGLVFRRRRRLGRHTWLNFGRRPSVTHRRGRVSVSSSGRLSVRLLRGLSWRQ